MDLHSFQRAVKPKSIGTQNAIKSLENQPLDFFLMLSSIASVLGTLSQSNYAAGNAFMDSIARYKNGRGTRFMSLNLSLVEESRESTAEVSADRMHGIYTRQACIILTVDDLLSMLEFWISTDDSNNPTPQAIMGIDYHSFAESESNLVLHNPMFNHFKRSHGDQKITVEAGGSQSLQTLISTATSIADVETIISEAVARKVSTLVALDYEEIDLRCRVSDLGLDSLVLIELKNWMIRTFEAQLQVSEITDSPNIVALARLIASRSAFMETILPSKTTRTSDINTNGESVQQVAPSATADINVPKSIPKQPLPDLDASLDLYIDSIRALFTKEEFKQTLEYVEELRRPGGLGRELQARLIRRAEDPQVENWQEEAYVTALYLRNDDPLPMGTNFSGVFPPSLTPYSPAEMAALISSAALEFKQKLQTGEIAGDVRHDQAIDVRNYQWLFNSCRMPGKVEDKVVKYPGNDYIVALRNGYAFKIEIQNGNEVVSYATLKSIFHGILQSQFTDVSWVGTLTGDNRRTWSKVCSDSLGKRINIIRLLANLK
jgi:aryl carrier-like protein